MSLPDGNRIELYYPPLTLNFERLDMDTESLTIKIACRLGPEFCYEKEAISYSVAAFDQFVADLSGLIGGRLQSVSLEDTHKQIKLSLSRYPKAALFELAALQQNSTYNSEARLSFSCPMHYDLLSIIRERFGELRKG
jgi:hypothetical protein